LFFVHDVVALFVNITVLQEDEEEDVGSYWMTIRKGEDILI